MSARFEELDWQQTPIGEISLRRRFDPIVRADLFEVKLDDEYLMSSLFTVAERELARLGIARTPGDSLDVVVGGLGLGYTARETLAQPRVREMRVIEYAEAVIDWHQRELLPDAAGVLADSRTKAVCADFFTAALGTVGFDPNQPGRVFDAVLLDIDHSPRHVLHDKHAALYTVAGLNALAQHLVPGGTFAMWSDGEPDPDFCAVLSEVFVNVEDRTVTFDNPLTRGSSTSTVYVATRPEHRLHGGVQR